MAWIWRNHAPEMQLWIQNYLLYYLSTKRLLEYDKVVDYFRGLVVCYWLFHIMLVAHPTILQMVQEDRVEKKVFQGVIVEVVQVISRFLEHGSTISFVLKVLDAQQMNNLVGLLYLSTGLWEPQKSD